MSSFQTPPPIPYATRPQRPQTLQDPATPKLPPRSQSTYTGIFDIKISKSAPELPFQAHSLKPLSALPLHQSGIPLHTQKFYANFLLGTQRAQIYPLPYVLKWSGSGLDINHIDHEQRVFGPNPTAHDAQYFFCPVNIVSMTLRAKEDLVRLETTNHEQFSVEVTLRPKDDSGRIRSSIVRGSAFITARYENLTVYITSAVMYRHISAHQLASGPQKWRVTLEDGKLWLIYALGQTALTLRQLSNGILEAPGRWDGVVQIAKLPSGDPAVESLIDAAAGSFPTSISLTGQVTHAAQYQYHIHTIGSSPALMYALPHHVESFVEEMSSKVYNNTLASQTNGLMTLVYSNEWHMSETLPEASHLAACPVPRPEDIALIDNVLQSDAAHDIEGQIHGDSMYFCGKALNKLAQITILSRQIQSARYEGLMSRFENGLMTFVRNTQQFPLTYEHTWGGIVSVQGFTDRGDGADFGNTWYNDHHYHYGYHISSAALYLKLKPESQYRTEIENWAKMLIRDVASPQADQWFCAYRSMDWFVGHSWSKGLYESADGKDEESSSEDYHFTYAMHLFAEVIDDSAMRDRAKIQLAVQRHAINLYMLFAPDNQIMPQKMIANCVSGIKFENKIDYTTYFGANREYIHGIHILPITPVTSFFRSRNFTRNEWQSKLQELVHATPSTMQPGWRGLLFASIGLCEGQGGAAWQYFLQDEPCDDGVCRSWLLAMISSSH